MLIVLSVLLNNNGCRLPLLFPANKCLFNKSKGYSGKLTKSVISVQKTYKQLPVDKAKAIILMQENFSTKIPIDVFYTLEMMLGMSLTETSKSVEPLERISFLCVYKRYY